MSTTQLLDFLKSSDLQYMCDNKLGSIIISGYVKLCGSKITTLPSSIEIFGSLDISETKITELPSRLNVRDFIYVNKHFDLSSVSKNTIHKIIVM